MTDPSIERNALLTVRSKLVETAAETTDEGLQHRCRTLIQNIDGLQKHPDDKALLAQFAANTNDLERYKAGLSGRGTDQ
jgi:hypothetical protein